ncbi:hypothetical protein N0V90_005188 [Kalmusia sp. IMI 367209]|nr:hypothetical protein N0V90_005188 [Kalmusia sp. IMI 367209]
METPYQYAPLSSPTHFRLLRVSKIKLHEEQLELSNIDLDIAIHDLEAKPAYTAISYVWGTGTETAQIRLGTCSFLVISKLLYTALPQLLKADATGYLWIDQICIDQQSVDDKNHQVRLMGDIYRNCDEVLIHLAPELWTRRAYQTLEYVEQTSRDDQRQDKEDDTETYGREADEITFEDTVSGILNILNGSTNVKVSCATFFNHPWFTRGWVVQEVALAPHARFLACGSSFDAKAVVKADRWRYRESLEVGSDDLTDTTISNYRKFSLAANFDKNTDPLRVLEWLSSPSELTLAQDHIYAFIGIMDELDLVPDYTLAWHDVFMFTAAKIIDFHGDLAIFRKLTRTYRGLKRSRGSSESNPGVLRSWVPYWMNECDIAYSPPKGDLSLSVCKYRKHTIPATTELPHLRVRGGLVGNICGIERIRNKTNHTPTMHGFMRRKGGNSAYHAFVLSSGLSGRSIGGIRIKKNDIVCILHGSYLPVILRHSRGSKHQRKEALYTFVDLCELQSSMKGELVTWEEDQADEFLLC